MLDFPFIGSNTSEMASRFAGTRIGLDLDNTLISYDQLFYAVARERNLVPSDFSGSKRDIRDHVRLSEGDLEWQRLQAQVYGPAIAAASAADGALDFIRQARKGGAELTIVSHKTEFSNLGSERVNLREAARLWLRESGMLGPDAVPEENIYFESTRAEKIARIIALGCTHFVDDLEEVLNDPTFPPGVERFLLASADRVTRGPYRMVASFHEIADAFKAC